MKQRGLIPNFYILRAIVGKCKSEKMQNLQISATYFAIHLIKLIVNWKKVELRFISFNIHHHYTQQVLFKHTCTTFRWIYSGVMVFWCSSCYGFSLKFYFKKANIPVVSLRIEWDVIKSTENKMWFMYSHKWNCGASLPISAGDYKQPSQFLSKWIIFSVQPKRSPHKVSQRCLFSMQ